MFKKIFSKIFLSVALIGATSCSTLTKELLKDPEVQISDFQVENVSLKDVAINLKLNVKNPNPIPLSLGKVNYSLQFSGNKVTEGTFDKGIEIPASGEGQVIVPLKFEYNAIGNLIDGFLKKSLKKDYEISGTAQFGLFSIPFVKKGEVNLEKK